MPKSNDGATPLLGAAINNPNPEVTVALVKAGANVNAKKQRRLDAADARRPRATRIPK